MNTKEFAALNDLFGAINVQWGVVSPCSPKVKNHLFCFVQIQGPFVDYTSLLVSVLPFCMLTHRFR